MLGASLGRDKGQGHIPPKLSILVYMLSLYFRSADGAPVLRASLGRDKGQGHIPPKLSILVYIFSLHFRPADGAPVLRTSPGRDKGRRTRCKTGHAGMWSGCRSLDKEWV